MEPIHVDKVIRQRRENVLVTQRKVSQRRQCSITMAFGSKKLFFCCHIKEDIRFEGARGLSKS